MRIEVDLSVDEDEFAAYCPKCLSGFFLEELDMTTFDQRRETAQCPTCEPE